MTTPESPQSDGLDRPAIPFRDAVAFHTEQQKLVVQELEALSAILENGFVGPETVVMITEGDEVDSVLFAELYGRAVAKRELLDRLAVFIVGNNVDI